MMSPAVIIILAITEIILIALLVMTNLQDKEDWKWIRKWRIIRNAI